MSEVLHEIEKWLPRKEESTARAKLRELAADRDEGWRQFNAAEIGRLNAEKALREADRQASKAHDAMWAMDFDKTAASTSERAAWERQRKTASDAIWKLHDKARAVLGSAQPEQEQA